MPCVPPDKSFFPSAQFAEDFVKKGTEEDAYEAEREGAKKLVDRVRDAFQSSTRRSAAHQLCELISKDAEAHLFVGHYGMPVLMSARVLRYFRGLMRRPFHNM